MKINEVQRIGTASQYQRTGDSRASGVAGRKELPKDEVLISPQAQELLGSSAAEDSRREGQALRIDTLKRAVSTGNYHIEAGKVAEKLLPYIL